MSDVGKVIQQDRSDVITNTELAVMAGYIPIALPNPFEPDKPWYMRQPTDTEYDLALAVRDAVRGKVLAEPEMRDAMHLPPSEEWTTAQRRAIADVEDKIAELRTQMAEVETPSPIDSTLMGIYEEHLASLIKPEEYTLALEIASRTANRGFQNYLIPRLLVDENRRQYLNMNLPADKERWEKLGRNTHTSLRMSLTQVIAIVNTAKN